MQVKGRFGFGSLAGATSTIECVLPHREIEIAQLEYPTLSQYTDTGPTSSDTNLIMLALSEAATRIPIIQSLV